MDTQMNKPLTIKEYAASHGLSETTVRRRIRAGGLDARLEHGRYFIYGQNGVQSGEEADRQFEQADAHRDSQTRHADSPDHDDHQALIDRLSSEVDYLRGQLNKQMHLLAASTAQNSDMVKQLQAPPRRSLIEKARKMFDRRPTGSPDAPDDVEVS